MNAKQAGGRALVALVALMASAAVVSPALAADDQTSPAAGGSVVDTRTIEPGEMMVFICGWGYKPAAREGALTIDGVALDARKVVRTATGQRVLFSHRVEVRDQADHRFRLVINRGSQVVDYRNDCTKRS